MKQPERTFSVQMRIYDTTLMVEVVIRTFTKITVVSMRCIMREHKSVLALFYLGLTNPQTQAKGLRQPTIKPSRSDTRSMVLDAILIVSLVMEASPILTAWLDLTRGLPLNKVFVATVRMSSTCKGARFACKERLISAQLPKSLTLRCS